MARRGERGHGPDGGQADADSTDDPEPAMALDERRNDDGR